MKELLQKISTRIVEESGYSKDKSDKHGEVFTPVELINEMLDKLPEEVWKDSTKTFYDPCAGKGNFPIEIVKRLFDSLEEKIEDPEERLRHIIENQIFMSEYQKESAEFCDAIFTFGKDYKVNIYFGDSLNQPEEYWDLSWEERREKYPEESLVN